MAVARRHDLHAHLVEGAHTGELGLLAAHAVAGDHAVCVDVEGVADDGGHAELLDEGHGELLEGVAQDDDLRERAQLVEELAGAGQRLERGDDLLDVLDPQAVLAQDVDAVLHELVVVGLVAGGALELGDASSLGELDPDLGREHAFHIQAGDVHGCLLQGSLRSWPVCIKPRAGICAFLQAAPNLTWV